MVKSVMVRVDPHVAGMFDELAETMQGDPELLAKYGDTNGHISRSVLLREAIARGYASLRQQVSAPPEKPTPKPTPKPARKPAKKAAKRRR